MQSLPGFRDFLPKDCAVRNYIFDRWREVARRYGFVEWDGPLLEPTALYTKKSGPEIVAQLFNFTDKGDREFWIDFLRAQNVPEEQWQEMLQAIDKSEREPREKTAARLGPLAEPAFKILDEGGQSKKLDWLLASL